jgi:hypothetical protein
MESNTSSLLQKSNHDNNDEQDNEKMQFLDEIFRVNEEEENKKDEEIKIEEDFIINTNIPRTRKKLTSSQFLIYLTLFLVLLIVFRSISFSKIKILIFICLLMTLLSLLKKKKGIILKKIMEQILYMKILIESINAKMNENNIITHNNVSNSNDTETQRLNADDELEDPLLNI